MPPLERAKMLRAIADVLRKNGDELAMLDAADCGNPYAEMVRDANAGAAQLDFYAGLVTEMKGASIPMGPDVVNFSVREPLGVVGRIIPFNHPFMFAAGKSGAPLAAGNTVVLKPPEQAPLSALRLAELIDGILPPGVWNVVPGGREVGQVLSSHPDVAMVALIGSVPTGRAVMKAASDTLKPVLLELGGKNALIAYPDADLEAVSAAVVDGMNFTWCGQSCGSTSRAFIHEKIYDAVLERAAQSIKRYKPGDPTDPATTMGSIINQVQYDRVLKYIAAGKEDGARLVSGGKRPDDPKLAKGLFIEPTIFADVNMGMRIGKEEIFGPVLSVFKWKDEAEMLAQVNQVEYGLTCSIWTNDLATAHRTAAAVEAGYRLDQRGVEAFPRRAVRRLQAVRRRPRGMHRGADPLHAREEHPRESEAAQRTLDSGTTVSSGPPSLWAGRNLYSLPPKAGPPRSVPEKGGGFAHATDRLHPDHRARADAGVGAAAEARLGVSRPRQGEGAGPRFAPDRVRTVNGVSYTRAAVDEHLQHPGLASADASADVEGRPARQQGHAGARLRLLPSADRHRPSTNPPTWPACRSTTSSAR